MLFWALYVVRTERLSINLFFFTSSIDAFHIVISLSNRSSIEKSIKPFLKMKGQIAY